MFSWLRSMSRTERLTILACFLGWALDAMDTQAANLLLPTLGQTFDVGKPELGLMATTTLISAGLGGWLAGAASDRYGRIVILQITIAWFSLGSLLCALAPSFEFLMAARIFQGIGFGGEWAVGAVLVAEITKPQWRATAVGVVQSGYSIGLALAAGLYYAAFSLLPDDVAWRAVFFAGVLPAILIVFIRRAVREPIRSAQAGPKPPPAAPWRIFQAPYRRATALGAMLCLMLQGASAAITVWLPSMLVEDRGMSTGSLSLFFLLQSAGAFFGYLVAAFLADRLGRRISLWIFIAGAMCSISAICFVPVSPGLYLALAVSLGFFGFGVFSNFGPVLSELYPAHVRGSGQGFCYNFGRGIGSVFPALVGLMVGTNALAPVVGVVALAAYVTATLVVLLLPETRGKILDADPADDAPAAVITH